MLASILVTLLAVPAALGALIVVASTQGYLGRVPSGSNAMGLVVPLFISAGSGILMVIAAWICAASGGLEWIIPARAAGLALASVVSIGVGLAAAGVLIAWMERMGAWVAPIGHLCGTLGPACLGAFLIASTWMRPESLMASSAPKLAAAIITIVAIAGIGFGLYGLQAHLRRSAENSRRVLKDHLEREAEWERRRSRAPIDALREDYAEMSPLSPLWVFVASLPDTTDDECRQFTIARALRVPEFEEDFARTLTCTHPRYRHGCADLIRFAPPGVIRDSWATPLAKAIARTAEEIASGHTLTESSDTNPNPIEHIRALIDAARTLRMPETALTSLRTLERAVNAAPPSEARDKALAMLTSVH